MRFKEEGRVMHIQVREGEIGREFLIDKETVKWVSLPNIAEQIDSGKAREGIHYHSFKPSHAFNMNKILLKGHRVVVGIRFAKSELKAKEEVQIEIQVKSMVYNPSTGKLLQGTDQWEKSTSKHDSKIDVAGLLPQTAESGTIMKSDSNSYVKLRASDFDEDAGQTTLPLFDAHVLELKPPSSFGGIGMHYRAAKDHSGFIGISGYSLDYVGFLDHSEDNG